MDINSGVWAETDYEFRISRKFSFYYCDEPVAVFIAHSEYPHRSAFYQNWLAILMVGGRYLKSGETSIKMRLRFLVWFLKEFRRLTLQIPQFFENKGEHISKLMEDSTYILKSYKTHYLYIDVINIYIYTFIRLSPMMPLLRFLKSALKRILQSPVVDVEKKYRVLLDSVLKKLER